MIDNTPHFRYQPKADSMGRPIKHKWGEETPGFRQDQTGHPEGMCPSTISPAQAEALLNSGLPASPLGWRHSHPKYIYNVHDGVVYKAVETVPGISYHGFPCPGPRTHPRKPDMTKRMQNELLAKAERDGCRAQVEQWFQEHP